MTTEYLQTEEQRYLRDLADVYTEPVLANVFAEMRLYNELLASEPVSEDRITEIMQELDAKWSPFMGQAGMASGYFSFLPERLDDAQMLRREYYRSQDVVFEGVLPVPLDDEGDDQLQRYELQIKLVRDAILYDDEHTEAQKLSGLARLDDIVSLEFPPHMMSQARAQHWLEYYHDDEITEIDMRILNLDGDECDIVHQLEDMTIDCKTPHAGDSELIHRSLQALDIYTNSLFSFDQQMPYDVYIGGNVWSIAADGSLHEAEITGVLHAPVKIARVLWRPAFEGGEYAICAHLDMSLLTPDKDAPSYRLLVPVDAVEAIASFRQLYFGEEED